MVGGRYWVVGTGYWILDTGYWAVGTGCWAVGAGWSVTWVVSVAGSPCNQTSQDHWLSRPTHSRWLSSPTHWLGGKGGAAGRKSGVDYADTSTQKDILA